MSDKVMTRGQLAEMVQAQVKDFIGTELAASIRKNIEEAVAPLRQKMTDWGSRITDRAAATPLADWRSQLPEGTDPRGLALSRCVRATALARTSGMGPDGAIQILRSWGDKVLADMWHDARTKAMSAGDATAGGYLVPTQFINDFIAVLRARTVIRALGTPTIPIAGTAEIPKATAGATASYGGENTNAPKSEVSTGNLVLSFKKLRSLVPIGNSLLRYNAIGADVIVRNDMSAAMSVTEDSKFIRGDGTDGAPKGLRFWAPNANIITANGTVSVANTFSDLGKLMQQLMGADIPMSRPAWIFAPRSYNFLVTLINSQGNTVFKDEMTQAKTLWGYPFGVTTGIPTNLDFTGNDTDDESEVYFVDVDQCLIGEGETMSIEASREAAYHDGSAVQSAWSRDETVVRAIAEHDFVLRYDKAVAVLAGVDWAPGSV